MTQRLLLNATLERAASCRVAARDSGKVMVDAAFGELMVTCEKMMWLVHEGGQYIAPEYRQPGRMVRPVVVRALGLLACHIWCSTICSSPYSLRRPGVSVADWLATQLGRSPNEANYACKLRVDCT